VRSLFVNRTPPLIMSIAFAISVALIYWRAPHWHLLALGGIGICATCARLLVLHGQAQAALDGPLDKAAAGQLERLYAVPMFAFAVALGAFGAAVFQLAFPQAHMLIVALAVGYCAGVATGVGLRPLIAIPSMAAAILPVIVSSLLWFDSIYLGLGALLLALFLGGAHSIVATYAIVKSDITKRLTFGSLARQDGLTRLPNRLALREYFEEHAALSPPDRLVAVHYLDLDGFKPVNDRHGHATGDALLAAVGERLNGAVRSGDIVARLGGDEFAVLQFGLQRAEDARLLALRASAALRQPFRIGDHSLRISASIGTVTAEAGCSDLDAMLAEADRNLYTAKRGRTETHLTAA
jgi:diguanylate cyclase (GGDEF)-like protein